MKDYILLLLGIFLSGCQQNGPVNSSLKLAGEKTVWKPLTISIEGPETSEQAAINPFLHYRLNAWFAIDGDTFRVPGYYAADGNSQETSAGEGNIWQVKFTPDQAGTWNYGISFRAAHNIALNDSAQAGEPLMLDGSEGSFEIKDADPAASGFYGKGRLQYTGSRYLQHGGTGEYFLKGGSDSPENFLAFAGFDNTPPSHYYQPHLADWQPGDPLWQNEKGKGLIGAMNYLKDQGMNVIYMLTMNVLGDGNDVFPWTNRDERYRFDCSKLAQWDLVFEHFDRLGIQMHLVTQENENQLLLDAGFTHVQRKLYYRELVARFSHHLGVVWNMGEENGRAPWYDNLGQTDKQRLTMAAYLHNTDPYHNLLVFHTLPDDPQRHDQTEVLLGQPSVDGVSLQVSDVYEIHQEVKKWIRLSSDSGRQWVVNLDEIGPWYMGVAPDSVDQYHDTVRVQALWGTYMAGGAGTEWYLGKSDLTLESQRHHENMWKQTRVALEFFNELPFWEMGSHDKLISGGEAWCFAKPGEVYVVYFPTPGQVQLQVSDPGSYEWQSSDPSTGEG